jgi:hypothetical protein
LPNTAELRVAVHARRSGPFGGRAWLAEGGRAVTSRRLGGALLVFAIALAAWPYSSLVPGIGADANWIAALAFIDQHGMRYGDQIVWTYGPLGFLDTGPLLYYGSTALVAFAFQWLVQLLLTGTLYLALRRSFPAVVACVVAAVVTAVLIDRVVVLGGAWCLLALIRQEDSQRSRVAAAFPPAIGVVTGIALLGKLDQGIELSALAVIALLAAPSVKRRRDGALFGAALLGTVAVGWVGTGQTLSDVWPYLRNGEEIVRGYAAAMGFENPAMRWAYWAAALIAAVALVRVLNVARGGSVRQRLGLLAIWGIAAFIQFKAAFVRQDAGHMLLFFGDMLMLLAVLPARPAQRSFALAGIASCVVFVGAVGPYDFGGYFDAVHHAKTAVDEVSTLATRDDRGRIKSQLRQAIVAHYAMPPQILAGVGRRTVAFWPHAYGDLVYAYDLDWRPLPVLEPYSAYTPALDRLGGDMLASRRAPQRIVRSTVAPIDGRHPSFEAPFTSLAILCRYRPLIAEPSWQLLARAPDRCGAPRVIDSVTAAWGASVAVPEGPRGAMVLVRIEGAGEHGVERLRSLWLRPHLRWISLDGKRYRLVAATAPDGLLLRVPAGADYRAPFAMAPNPSRIAVSRDGGNPGGTLRYTFVAAPVRSWKAAPR